MFPALPSPEPHQQVDEYDGQVDAEIAACACCGDEAEASELVSLDGDRMHIRCKASVQAGRRLEADLAAMVAIVNGGMP